MEKISIMIVEDEFIVAEDVRVNLEKMNYRVCATATTGEQAVAQATKELPDLILMDVILRGRMDGIEAADRIHRQLGIPVIFLSAHADDALLERAKAAEPFGYLLKPFTNRDLRSAIEMTLYKAQMERKLRESESRFRLLAENARDLIFRYRFTPSPAFDYISPAATKITGYTPQEHYANIDLITQQIDPDDRQRIFDQQQVSEWIGKLLSYRLRRKDGTEIWVEQRSVPVYDDQGRIIAIEGIARDITENKQAADALSQAYDELEQRVAERTLDLLQSNEQLNREIKVRRQAEEKLLTYQARLRSLSSELLLAEERERRRIATEIHDRIGQTLAAANIQLGAFRATSAPEDLGPLDDSRKLIEQAIADSRTLTFELSPPVLYELGLEAALDWLADKVQEKHGISIRIDDDGQPKPLDDGCRIFLFQAARELLFNIVRHARATRAKISIRKAARDIRVEIADNGIGFDPLKTDLNVCGIWGFGLFCIRERLRHIGGRLGIESAPGKGTRVELILPLLDDPDSPEQ